MATAENLKQKLRAVSNDWASNALFEPSEEWNIVEGFVSGKSVPHHLHPGCYALFAADGELQYIGRATKLGVRLARYWKRKDGSPKVELCAPYTTLRTIKTETKQDARDLEAELINAFSPPSNKRRERIRPR